MQPSAAPYLRTMSLPPLRRRRVYLPGIVLGAILALSRGPVAAQEASPAPTQPPPGAFLQSTAGFSYLQPLTPGALSRGIPGIRLSEDWGLTPAIGMRASFLQIGGKEDIVQGGSIGVRWSHLFGPVRVSPGAELLVGHAVVDSGGYYVQSGTGETTYRPYRRSSRTWARGVGLVANAEWFHRSGLGIGLVLGYWRVMTPKPGGALMLGAGVRLGRRDPPWYWRTSGKDHVPPRMEVISPRAGPDGARQLDANGLRILAADPSGIEAVEIDGAPMHLQPAKADAVDAIGAQGPGVIASLRPAIKRGTQPLHVEVTDGAGNRTTGVVLASVPDPGPPAIVVISPAADTQVQAPYVDVAGATPSFEPGMRVKVNGCIAMTNPTNVLDGPGRGFQLRVGLKPGTNVIEVETTDPYAGSNVVRQQVTRVPAAGDGAPHGPPVLTVSASPAVSGSATRVRGTVRDTAGVGIAEVLVDGAPANLQFTSDDRRQANFLAFAAAGDGTPVDVRTTTLDGRVADGRAIARSAAGRAPSGAALLIGVETYAADYIAGPANVAGTAAAMANLLRTRGVADFGNRTRVLTNEEATQHEIRYAMRWLAQAARGADVVYIYVAGHGVRGAQGEAVGFVPHDVHAAYGLGAVPWADFEQLYESLNAEVVVVTELVDDEGDALAPPANGGCGSGAVPAGGLAVLSAGGAADGSFSRRALDLLSGRGSSGGTPVRLRDLLRDLDATSGTPTLRTIGSILDPALPLTTAPSGH